MFQICRVVVSEIDRVSCKESTDCDWKGLDNKTNFMEEK